jgi:hypothetical protein
MSYDVSITEHKDYLRVQMSGKRNSSQEPEDSIRAWTQITEACDKANLDRILVVSNITGRLETLAPLDIARSHESFGWSKHFKMAFVSFDEESWNDISFAETVGVNRGFFVKLFDNEQDAKAWLLSS